MSAKTKTNSQPRRRKRTTSPPGYSLYFAYGSNLSTESMRHRCPDSIKLGTAVLQDWRLTFRGVADVEESEGDVAFGGLWLCPPRDIRSLDRYEGVAGGFYRKRVLTVQAEDGPMDALVYVMNPTPLDNRSLPSQHYFGTIAAGYRDYGLPLDALQEALDATYKRVVVIKGVTEFVPHGPKRMGPAGTERPQPQQPKPRRPKAEGHRGRVITKSPATLAIEAMERRDRERGLMDDTCAVRTATGRPIRPLRGDRRVENALNLAILEGAQ